MTWMQQKQVHLLGIAFFLVFDFIFYYNRVVLNLGISLPVYVFICLVFAVHIWFFNYYIVYLVHRNYPGLHQKTQKRLIAFLCIIPVSVLLTTVFQMLFFSLLNSSNRTVRFYVHFEDVGMNLLYSLIIIFFLELLFYFRHWAKAVTEAAELQQRNIEAQLDSLKSQVSPHFLFNSLNSLSSLIQLDPAQAVIFVHKLSGVYRYLLQSKDRNLIKIKDEFEFLQSYLHLLQTRFGNALHYTLRIDPAYEQHLIPPFTLQLLVENAVKHNIVAADHPLFVEVYNTGERLVVKNNLQKRKTLVASTGIGLINIIQKYALLTDAEVEITETSDTFVVSLPLLETNVYEGINYRR
jgi:two-component system, LytTR family, sensor kinase